MSVMSRSGASKCSSMLAVAGARLFSSATARAVVNDSAAAVAGFSRPSSAVFWVQRGYGGGIRSWSTVAIGDEEPEKRAAENGTVSASENKVNEKAVVVSYWGVSPSKITKEDGTEWKWSCFRVSFYFYFLFFVRDFFFQENIGINNLLEDLFIFVLVCD